MLKSADEAKKKKIENKKWINKCEIAAKLLYIYVVHLDRQSKVQCVNWYI